MSVERIVMNKRASLALGDSKMKRHKEVETLKTLSKRDHLPTQSREHSLIHVYLRVSSKPELDRAPAIPFSDCGRLVTLRVADVSMMQ